MHVKKARLPVGQPCGCMGWGLGLCFLGLGVAAGVGKVGHGGCHEDGGECAGDHAEEHCEGEAAD